VICSAKEFTVSMSPLQRDLTLLQWSVRKSCVGGRALSILGCRTAEQESGSCIDCMIRGQTCENMRRAISRATQHSGYPAPFDRDMSNLSWLWFKRSRTLHSCFSWLYISHWTSLSFIRHCNNHNISL
jgi:hypothetical protein